VNHLGITSVNLSLEARRVNLTKNTEDMVCSTTMIYVRVDGEGKPKAISKAN
jgi:acyl-CoA hydrolase